MELNERDFRKSYRRWFRRNKWLALRVKYLRNDDVHVERDRPGWFSGLSNDRLHVANSGSFLHHKCQSDFRSTGWHIAPFVVVNKRDFRESLIYRLCRCERQLHRLSVHHNHIHAYGLRLTRTELAVPDNCVCRHGVQQSTKLLDNTYATIWLQWFVQLQPTGHTFVGLLECDVSVYFTEHRHRIQLRLADSLYVG